MRLEKRSRLILTHVLESMTIAVLGGVIVAILKRFLAQQFSSLADPLASIEQNGIVGLIVFVLACLGIAFPHSFISTLSSLKRLPVHFGVLARVVIGVVVCLLLELKWPDPEQAWPPGAYVYSGGVLAGSCIAGLMVGFGLACLTNRSHRDGKGVLSPPVHREELDAWLADDQPVRTESESLFVAHSGVARRILQRLLSEPSQGSTVLPSIALIGPYGSGKTSICNLVEYFYRKDKETRQMPELLFCRFEAWQFLSAEAAVRNLIEVAADRIRELADVAALWRIPEKYIEAIKATGGRWSNFLTILLGGRDNPEEIVSAMGDVLVRLNVRLVIFVDDFDRIEEDSFATQQAIAKALNQLQNLPNTQYIISVGPTTGTMEAGKIGKRSWDLLKLTRFQELVPRVDPAVVVQRTKQLRERASKNGDYYLPWSEIKENEVDPLTWHPEFADVYSKIGFTGRLIRLVNTPRILKCTLRESNQAWEKGLKGEIEWHDLVLANALKAAEPGVFEWIARDRDVFIEEPHKNVTEPEILANKKHAKELEQRLTERIKSEDPVRYEIVKEAVCELFPAFETKLKGGESWSAPVPQWSQKIALRPNHGADYIERFFAGCVPEGDIRDQPTLQYIRRTAGAGFNVREFESLYLDSVDKLTGPFNKIVQFAGLIPHRLAYSICDAILEWIAEPKHAECWTEPERFMHAVLPDVFTILDNAGRWEKESFPRDSAVADETEKWFGKMVDILTYRSPLLAVLLVQGATEKGYKGLADKLLGHIKAAFVLSKQKLLPSLRISRFALAWLLEWLSKYDGYQEFKTPFTQSIIAEADREPATELRERIVFSLLSTTTPRRSGEVRPEEYQFSVLGQENEMRYDMGLIKEALNRWGGVTWSDEVAKRAFAQLQSAYCAGS